MSRLLAAIALCLNMIPTMGLGQLYEIKEQGKWGLMDANGAIVLAPRYDYLYPAEDDRYFITRSNGQSGLYHIDNGEIVPPEYDQIFVKKNLEGALMFAVQGKYGVLDPNTNEQIDPEYDEVFSLGNRVYAIRKGKEWGAKSLSGKLIIPIQFRKILSFIEEEQQFFCAYDTARQSHIWNQNGVKIIENIPHVIHDYVSGVFIYRKGRGFGVLGNSREPLTKAAFSQIRPLGSLLLVAKGYKWGLLSPEGDMRLPVSYYRVGTDTAGHYWFFDGIKWGCTDKMGRPLFKPQFSAPGKFQGPVSQVKVQKRYGVINSAGEFLMEPEYRAVRIYPGMVRYYQDSTWAQLRFDEAGKPIRSRRLIMANSAEAFKYMQTRSLLEKEDLLTKYGWVKEKNKWGLRDTSSGKLRIIPQFDSVAVYPEYNLSIVGKETFSELTARYNVVSHRSVQAKFPMIYTKMYPEDLKDAVFFRAKTKGGAMALVDPYSLAGSFRSLRARASFIGKPYQGRFRVRLGRARSDTYFSPESPELEERLMKHRGSWGLIDGAGRTKPLGYAYISPIVNGVFRFKSRKKWGLYDIDKGELLPATYGMIDDPGAEADFLITTMYGTKYSFLNEKGEFLFEKMADSLGVEGKSSRVRRVGEFSNGLLRAQIGRNWGYFDLSGEIAVAPQFRQAGDFNEGLAPVRGKYGWGYINESGEWMGPSDKPQSKKEKKARFRRTTRFQEGLGAVYKGKAWGYVNPEGRLQIRPKYTKALPFQSGYAIVKTKKWGLINEWGKTILKPKYDKIESFEGGFIVGKEGKYGIFSTDQNWILDLEYQRILPPKEDLMVFRQDNLYGVMNTDGQIVIDPSFPKLRSFSEGVAPVFVEGKWGFLNESGDVVIDPHYSQVGTFQEGAAAVAGGKPRRWGAINMEGDTIVPFQYNRIIRLPGGWMGCRTRDTLTDRSIWVYVDRYGVPANQQDFEEARLLRGTDKAIFRRAGKEYVINVNSQPVTNPGYDDIVAVGKDVIVGASYNLLGLIDRTGKELFPPQFEEINFRAGLYQVMINGKVGYLDGKGEWVRPLTE